MTFAAVTAPSSKSLRSRSHLRSKTQMLYRLIEAFRVRIGNKNDSGSVAG